MRILICPLQRPACSKPRPPALCHRAGPLGRRGSRVGQGHPGSSRELSAGARRPFLLNFAPRVRSEGGQPSGPAIQAGPADSAVPSRLPPAAPRSAGGAAVTRQGGNAGARPRRREGGTASALGSAPGRPDAAQPGRCGAGVQACVTGSGPGSPGRRGSAAAGRAVFVSSRRAQRRGVELQRAGGRGGSPGPRAGQRAGRTREPT